MSHRDCQSRPLGPPLAAAALAMWAVLVVGHSRSAEFTWTGNLNALWNDSRNWLGNSAPNSSTANTILDGNMLVGAVVDLDTDATVGTLRIDSGDTLNVPAGRHLNINGNATIDGNLNLLSGVSATNYLLFTGGDRVIGGIGNLSMASATSSIFVTNNTNNRLTFGSGVTVHGAGDLGVGITRFTNLGTIRADLSSSLMVNPSNIADAFINQGTLQATASSTLRLAGVTYTNTGGLIQAAGGFVEFASAVTIVGGSLSATSGGQIRTSGGPGTVAIDGVTLSGMFDLRNGNQLDIKNSIVNNGLLQVNSTGTITDVRMVGDVTISGNGTVILMNAANSRIYGDASAGPRRLTIGTGQTIRGTGEIGASQTKITNQGTILADQTTALTVKPANAADGFYNRGTIEVLQGSTFTFAAGVGTSLVQDVSTALTNVLGTMNVSELKLQAGTLRGKGTIVGSVSNVGGTVAPGESPGKLSISGNYTQAAGGTLVFEIDGTAPGTAYDLLAVSGSASLGGTAVLNFGFTPQPGASFVVLTASALTGQFTNIIAPAGWVITPVYHASDVTLTVTAVPEPEAYVLMLAGLGLVAWIVRSRRLQAETWPHAKFA